MGPILGAIGISLLYSFLTGALPGSWLYVLGGLFIFVVLFMPRGLTGAFGDAKAYLDRRLARRKAAGKGGAS
jgi:urea transport system permease protein